MSLQNMKTILSTVAIVLTAMTVNAQDSRPNDKPERAFTVNRAGTKEAFNELYRRLIKRQKTDLLFGRAILTTYPLSSWSALETGEVETDEPTSISVCDFVSDPAKPADRQDWTILTAPYSDRGLLERFSIEEIEFLHPFKDEPLAKYSRKAKDNNRVITRYGSNHALVSLGTEDKEPFLDFRLIGWTQDGQWRYPTNFDQWVKILDFCDPFSIELIGNNRTRLRFLHRQKTRQTLWVLEIEDLQECRVQSVVQYRVVKEAESKLYALPTKMFQSRFEYRESKLTRINYSDSRAAYRVDFQYPEASAVDDAVFGTRDFTANGEKLQFSPALEAELDAKFGK